MRLLSALNRVSYVVTRISLRVIIGKRRRDSFIREFWPFSYDFPKPILNLIPFYLRRKWVEDRWLRKVYEQWGTIHETRVMNFMRDLHGHVFVDVGANVGVYCVNLQDNFQRIIAIEADPTICRRLMDVAPSNCEVINLAASNVDGFVTFYGVKDMVGGLT